MKATDIVSKQIIALHTGDILTDKENIIEYSVVFVNVKEDTIIVCQRGITKLSLSVLQLNVVYKSLVSGIFEIKSKEVFVYDEDSMTASTLDANKKREALIKDIADKYGPDYSAFLKKNYDSYLRHDLPKKYGMKHGTVYNLFRKYMQSGCDITSIYDKRTLGNSKGASVYTTKTGKKPYLSPQGIIITDEVKAIFDKMLDYYHRKF